MMSTNHSERLKSLSPEKRVLLLKALGKEAVQAEQSKRIPRRSQQNSAPLSFAQQRLWFLDRLSPENPAYNLPVAVRLQGQLNLSAVQQTLNEIVRRHEVLRTAFAEVDGQPVQLISPSLNFALLVVNLRHLLETEQQAEIEQRTLEEAQRPFDLTRSPLLRGTFCCCKLKQKFIAWYTRTMLNQPRSGSKVASNIIRFGTSILATELSR